MNFNLQMFAEAVAGDQIIYFYRAYKDRATKNAVLFPLVTGNERTGSKSADSTATKDGSIRIPSPIEIEITSSSIKAKGDPNVAALEAAFIAGDLVECWEVDLSSKTEENKCDAVYYQGYFTDFKLTSESDGLVEIETTFGVNGEGASGKVTLSRENEDEIKYAFADLNKTQTEQEEGE